MQPTDTKHRMTEHLLRCQNKARDLARKENRVEPRQIIEFERQLDLLSAKLNLGWDKLRQFEQAPSQEDREAIKASLERIANEIENAIDSAWSKVTL